MTIMSPEKEFQVIERVLPLCENFGPFGLSPFSMIVTLYMDVYYEVNVLRLSWLWQNEYIPVHQIFEVQGK